MSEIKKRKTDRRTIYTINVIKEAFIDVINQGPYSKVTISKICREAEITRSTFYIHFSSITDVLNEVLDDALLLTQDDKKTSIGDNDLPFDYLDKNESLIPACQRIGNSNKYQRILMDPDLSEYIIGRIMLHERSNVVPSIIKKTGLSEEDAETIFHYIIHGSFAVNRAHHFIKDEKWAHDVQMLNRFAEAGYENLIKKA